MNAVCNVKNKSLSTVSLAVLWCMNDDRWQGERRFHAFDVTMQYQCCSSFKQIHGLFYWLMYVCNIHVSPNETSDFVLNIVDFYELRFNDSPRCLLHFHNLCILCSIRLYCFDGGFVKLMHIEDNRICTFWSLKSLPAGMESFQFRRISASNIGSMSL